MRATAPSPPATDRPFRKRPGLEPLPGYRLIEPLGRGGFGEVWKCEAPGGLHKAVKFVADVNDPNDPAGEASLRQEFDAFERIKRIRHPFLLTLERVELVPGDLVMVMELADEQLGDRYAAYAARGHAGIPRDELLGYLADAAEVLDHIGSKHGLQHLDIKPANLFLVCGRVKVGDFGLVRRHEVSASPGADRGLTPRYVAPEILLGRVDPRSDQYCLALVYQELLTGQFPYPAKSAQQMMLQHATAAPDLSALPAHDRPAVARALAKAPTDRFASCLDFVRALMAAPAGTTETWASADPGRKTSLALQHARLTRSTADLDLPPAPVASPGLDPMQVTGPTTRPVQGRLVTPGLTTPGQRAGHAIARNTPAPPEPDAEVFKVTSPSAATAAPSPVRLPRIWPVVPVHRLTTPSDAPVTAPDAGFLIEAVVASLCADGRPPAPSGGPVRNRDGTWGLRFPCRPVPGTVALKLGIIREAWGAEVEAVGPDTFAVRREYKGGGFWSKKKTGLEVIVKLPKPGTLVGDATLTGQLFGPADAALIKAAEQLMPVMLDEVRAALENADDRRKTARVPTTMPVTLYPVHGDGTVDHPIPARMRDISAGGLCSESQLPADTAYVYAIFPDVAEAANWAVLTRLTRGTAETTCHVFAGRFRPDL